MKETYERTEMTVIKFDREDVITTSGRYNTRFHFDLSEYQGGILIDSSELKDSINDVFG